MVKAQSKVNVSVEVASSSLQHSQSRLEAHEQRLREEEEAEAENQRVAREREDAWRAEQDGLRVLHTQAEAKLASQLDESRKLLDAQREESRAQLSSLGDEMLRYRAEAEAAHEARGQAEAALP